MNGAGTTDCPNTQFAIAVANNSTTVFGTANNILGAPDLVNGVPLSPLGAVDYDGSVTIEFAQAFTDGVGIDVTVVGGQLDEVEGWEMFVGPTATSTVSVGTFAGSPSGQLNPNAPFTVEVDFNGTFIPPNSRFIRMVSENGTGNGSPFGFDYDAVCVSNSSAVSVVPTLSQWGLILLALFVICGGAIAVWKRKTAPAA